MMSALSAVTETIDRASRNVSDAGVRPAGRIAPTVAHCAWPALAVKRRTIAMTDVRANRCTAASRERPARLYWPPTAIMSSRSDSPRAAAIIKAPLSGPLVRLIDVPDPVFAQKIVGDG